MVIVIGRKGEAMTEFNDKLAEAIQALKEETIKETITTWLGDYSPYQCERCGFHVDRKTRYCPDCGRRASNYEM